MDRLISDGGHHCIKGETELPLEENYAEEIPATDRAESVDLPESPPTIDFRLQREQDTAWCAEVLRIAAEGSFEPPGSQPAQLTDDLFLGGVGEASRVTTLKRLGITAVVNMAPKACREAGHEGYEVEDGLVLLEQAAADHFKYPLLDNHLRIVEDFIEQRTGDGGRVLVHCYAGMNRSAAICAAFLIRKLRMPISDAVRLIVERRGKVLTNEAFILQLVILARNENLLY